MKKWTKIIATISMVCLFVCLLGGCSKEYNFYDDWTAAGADIKEENIFVQVDLEEVQKMREDKKTFALLYASSQQSAAVTWITSLQAQAEYLGKTDKTIYYLNSAHYEKKVSEVKEVLEMTAPADATPNSASGKTGQPIMMTFINGRVDVDTSQVYIETPSIFTQPFISGKGSGALIKRSALASYIFYTLLA